MATSARDALAGREQHVELAWVRLRRDLAREVEGRRGVSHRGDRCHDPNVARACLDEALRDVLILSGSATEPPNFMTTVPLFGSACALIS